VRITDGELQHDTPTCRVPGASSAARRFHRRDLSLYIKQESSPAERGLSKQLGIPGRALEHSVLKLRLAVVSFLLQLRRK
jgi:hypothetical protein